MESQYLRDAAGAVYAIIDQELSGNQSIRTFEHGWVGRYYAAGNFTIDLRTGQIVAGCNALTSLVPPPRY